MAFSSKEEKSKRIMRGLKTVFFLITMVISLLLFSAPVLLVVADALLPSALLSTISSSSLSLENLAFHFHDYDFRYSLVDIPLISIIRSFIIFCKYTHQKSYKSFFSLVANFGFNQKVKFCSDFRGPL